MLVQEPPRTHIGCRDCSASPDSLIRAYDRKCSGRVIPRSPAPWPGRADRHTSCSALIVAPGTHNPDYRAASTPRPVNPTPTGPGCVPDGWLYVLTANRVPHMRVPKHLLIPSLVAVAIFAAGCSSAATSAKPPPPSTAPPSTAPTSTTSDWTMAQGGKQALVGWLDGVDCVTATSCVAVGSELTAASTPGKALVETLNQGSWSSNTAPPAPGSDGDYLFSVSCPSVGNCVAVGYFFRKTSGGGNGTVLIETLANGTWSVTPTPSLGPNVADSFLYGVSCSAPTSCVAVGNSDAGDASTNAPIIMTLSNGSWDLSPPPNLGSQEAGGLLAVSCVSPTACTAAGYRATGPGPSSTLVESLSGDHWSVVSSPGSGGPSLTIGAPTGLSGLSCVATSCVAVGQLTGPVPTLDILTNQRWSAASSPNPDTKDGATGLFGVSCTATTTCVAVGDLAKANGSNTPDGGLGLPLGTLIETDSGGTWAIAASPSGLPADSGLHGVSCVGKSCVAVGQSGQFTSSTSTTKTLIVQTP